MKKDTKLIAHVNEEQLVLQTRLQALRDAQAYFSKLRPIETLWSEELIKERRKEARRELRPNMFWVHRLCSRYLA